MKHPATLHSPLRAPTSLHRLVAVALTALSLHPLKANAQAHGAESDSHWGLGLGAAITRKPYSGMDDETRALPLVLFENRWISVAGPRIDLKLPSAGPVDLTLRVKYADDGYEADDALILSGMADRKSSFWAGTTAIWRNDIADLSVEWLGDVSGHSNGQQFNVTVERGFDVGQVRFTPRIAAKWLDSRFVDYYFGVTSAEARLDRGFYEGGATVNMELGVRMSYAFTPRQSTFVDLSGTRLGSAIKNSPLVGRSNESSLRLGYLYRF